MCVRAGVSWRPRLLPFHFPRAWPGYSGLRCPGAPGAVNGHSTDGRAGARAPGRCFSAGLLSPPCAFWLQFCEPQLRGCRRLLASGARLTRWRFVDAATELSQHLAGLALLPVVKRHCLLGPAVPPPTALCGVRPWDRLHGARPSPRVRSAQRHCWPRLWDPAFSGSPVRLQAEPSSRVPGSHHLWTAHWYCLQQV